MPRLPLLVVPLALSLAACEATPEGTEAQLRGAVASDLRRAGVSEACIASLDRDALAQINAFELSLPRASVGTTSSITRRNRLRTFTRRYCPGL